MVEHEQLWAPWRLAYVSGEAAAEASKEKATELAELELLPGADRDCFLCRAVVDADERTQSRRGAERIVDRYSQSLSLQQRPPARRPAPAQGAA